MAAEQMISTETDSKRAVSKLVRLNLIVVASLLALSTLVVNMVVEDSMYSSVDAEMEYLTWGFLDSVKDPPTHASPAAIGIRPTIYVHTSDGEYFNPYLSTRENKEETSELLQRNIVEGYSNHTVGERTYRVQKVVHNTPEVLYVQTEEIWIDEAIHFRDITSEYQVLTSTKVTTIVGMVVTLILFVVFNYIFSAKAIRPIKHSLDSQIEFAANISHELRNPLAIIKVNVGLLESPSSHDAEVQQKLTRGISDNADKMKAMLDDLLVIARSTSAKSSLEFKSTDLDEVLSSLSEDFETRGRLAGIAYAYDSAGPLFVLGNKELLEKMFEALLDNAFEYSYAPGSVTVCAHSDGAKHTVTIGDKGIGISPEDLKCVVSRFHRGQEALKVNPQGSGLGVSIALGIAEQHNATLTIESELGVGTTVVLTFPATKQGS